MRYCPEKKRLVITTSIFSFLFVLLYTCSYLYWDKPIAYAALTLQGTLLYRISDYTTNIGGDIGLFVLLTLLLVGTALYRHVKKTSDWPFPIPYYWLSMLFTCFLTYFFKKILGRYRPPMLFDHGLYGFHFFSWDWAANSSPSGHASAVVVLAVCFALTGRRYAIWWFLFALYICLTRIILHVHYLSDVFFGAYLGSMTAIWIRYLLEKHSNFNKSAYS